MAQEGTEADVWMCPRCGHSEKHDLFPDSDGRNGVCRAHLCPSTYTHDVRIVIWDHREQVPVEELNALVSACVAKHGRVRLTPAPTGSDDYAIAVSPDFITEATARAAVQSLP